MQIKLPLKPHPKGNNSETFSMLYAIHSENQRSRARTSALMASLQI
jgi:hypothetical protein